TAAESILGGATPVTTLMGTFGGFTFTDAFPGFETIVGGGSGAERIVGAAHDTLIGGSGNGQVLNALAGPQFVIQGTGGTLVLSRSGFTGFGPSAVYGAAGDTIVAATAGPTSTSSAQIVASAGSMSVQINSAGDYTIASGAGDTITAAAGSANAVVSRAKGRRVDLTGNTGKSTGNAFPG